MKKLIAVAAVLVASVITANSQDTKMWIGGAASFQSSKQDVSGAEPVTMGVFSPSFGYNLNPNLTVGLSLDITGHKSSYFDDNIFAEYKEKISGFYVTPFVRYGKSAGDKLTLFGQLNIKFGGQTTSYESETTGAPSIADSKVGTFAIGVGPGLDYALTEAWSITAFAGLLGYNSENAKGNNGNPDVKTNSFAIGLDLTDISFGVFYHFGK